MSKTSVLSRPKVHENHQRNGFDRSRRISFNLSAGMILPLWWNYYTAGSRVNLNRAVILRSADVNTAAFQDVNFYMDFYKVPLRYLWTPWNDWKLGIQDLNFSSVLGVDANGYPDMPARVPNLNINKLEYNLISAWDTATTTAAVTKDSAGYPYLNGYFRLRDCFRYGARDTCQHATADAVPSYRVNLWPAQAYQKIYFDHYRNTAYESNNPIYYNADWLGSNTDIDVDDATNPRTARFVKELFNLRYVNLRRDMYRNIYPALNYVSSSPSGSTWSVPSSVAGISGSPLPNSYFRPIGQISPDNGGISGLHRYDTSNYSSISVQSIRALFALDKLMRASAFAPKHVKDQFKARFGVTMSDAVSFESERIGSFSTAINFQEVVSTAETQTGNDTHRLGTIGGKGIGTSNFDKSIETYCEEDCIIMAMCYVLPRVQYDCYGVDAWLDKLTPESYYQQEFENLGLEPVYVHEMVRASMSGATYNNNIVGYRPRNSIYKISPDLNFGLFKKRNYHAPYTTDADNNIVPGNIGFTTQNLTAFVTHDEAVASYADFWTQNGVSAGYFKCIPYVLNPIFAQSYGADGSPDTDQFFGMMEVSDGTIANMSVHGQPSL